MKSEKRRVATPTYGNGTAGTSSDTASLRAALANAAGVKKVSRAAFAKLVGAHANTVALWDAGAPVGPKYRGVLEDLQARIAKGEPVDLPIPGRPGRPRKAQPSAGPSKSAGRDLRSKSGTFDVAALRGMLGASRSALATLLGVSAGSVVNWESGKTVTPNNLARLRALEERAAAGQVRLPERKRGGRPSKGAPSKGTPVGDGIQSVPLDGTAPMVYANVVSLATDAGETLIRFGMRVPGSKARAVVDVVVPAELLKHLTR